MSAICRRAFPFGRKRRGCRPLPTTPQNTTERKTLRATISAGALQGLAEDSAEAGAGGRGGAGRKSGGGGGAGQSPAGTPPPRGWLSVAPPAPDPFVRPLLRRLGLFLSRGIGLKPESNSGEGSP